MLSSLNSHVTLYRVGRPTTRRGGRCNACALRVYNYNQNPVLFSCLQLQPKLSVVLGTDDGTLCSSRFTTQRNAREYHHLPPLCLCHTLKFATPCNSYPHCFFVTLRTATTSAKSRTCSISSSSTSYTTPPSASFRRVNP